MTSLIAVIDIGKTNAKLLLVDRADGGVVWSAERASVPVPSGSPEVLATELDIHGVWSWLIAELWGAPNKHLISALVPVAHGAAMVLVDEQSQALAAPDYEDPHFQRFHRAYAGLRDPFAETFSPLLAPGLNLGGQIYYLQQAAPDLFGRVQKILTYPQYWSWRLSGVAASEATSLGTHSDLWRPIERRFSDLVLKQGWTELLPPLRSARDRLGKLQPSVVEATGLSADCEVICGIHDSNASYLAHRIARPPEEPFAVVSSGTWCIILAHGGDLGRLREADDMLANVDALGEPTPTARFMGGREYADIAGKALSATPTLEGLEAVLATGAMALPSFAAAGPFAAVEGSLRDVDSLDPHGLTALATLYCALMADDLLDRLGVGGAIIVDGPFAANPLFAPILQSLRPAQPVVCGGRRGGVAIAALWLAGGSVAPEPPDAACADWVQGPALRAYREHWRSLSPA